MKKLLLMALLAVTTLTISAHFTIHSSTSGVKVESGGKTQAAAKGNAVKATDYLIIPAGGEVEIYNDLDKRIYRSVNTGRMSVTRLMMDARKIAADNNKTVGAHVNLGSKKKGNTRVYDEAGMVTREIEYADSCAMDTIKPITPVGAIREATDSIPAAE